MAIDPKVRFREIIKVFICYGFGFLFNSSGGIRKKSPQNFRKAIEELGPTFIKFGQILSTRRDILPKEYIEELRRLQDEGPIEDFNSISTTFYKSIGKTIEESFSYFNKEPIASASIAQVYEGILLDGRRVVVKIQRSDIYELMKTDIAILKKLFSFKKVRESIKVIDPIDVLNELLSITEKEVDFNIEKENMERFKQEAEGLNVVYVPKVINELCSERVLTQEYIEGFKINNKDRLEEEGYNKKEIIRKLALVYCKQIFDNGFFHGDPHPGNILIYEGKICFLDFGIMGSLDDYVREWLNEVMIAIALEDKERIVDFILAVGKKSGKVDRNFVYDGITSIFDNYLNTSLKNIKMTNVLEELIKMATENNILFPTELVLLMRGLLILEGVVEDLDPNFDIMEIVIDYVKMQSKGNLLNELSAEEILLKLYSSFRDASRIPKAAFRVLKGMEEGRTRIQFNINEVNTVINSLDRMINRLVGGLLISALIIGSSLIITRGDGPKIMGFSLIGLIGFVTSGFLALVLLISMIRAGEFKYRKK